MDTTKSFEIGAFEATLVEHAGDAIIVADADGVIRYWNAAAEVMFGYSPREALGESLDLIVPEKLRKPHWDGYHETMRTGQTKYVGQTLNVPAVRADGSRISVAFTVALLLADDGAVRGIGAFMRDVTADWEEKRELRRRVAELERELRGLRGDSPEQPA